MMQRLPKPRTSQDVLVLCREHDVQIVDLRFTSWSGDMYGVSIPISALDKQVFERGLRCAPSDDGLPDARPYPDRLILPQPDTVWIDPLAEISTAVLFCELQDPITGEEFDDDPRAIARRAQAYLEHCRVADQLNIATESEWWASHCAQSQHAASVAPSKEAVGGLQGKIDGRRMIPRVLHLTQRCGIPVTRCTWDGRHPQRLRVELAASPHLTAADHALTLFDLMKSLTTRPTGLDGASEASQDSARGVTIRLAGEKADRSWMTGSGYAGLSDVALHAIGGLLRHLPAIMALSSPTGWPGTERPRWGYSQSDSRAVCRIPAGGTDPHDRSIELRLACQQFNPYVLYAALVMAVIDGVQNKISAGAPLEHLDPSAADTPHRAAAQQWEQGDLVGALDSDYEFLVRGDVFSETSLRAWVGRWRTT
ncbi:MAG: hypothetical protein D6753_00355 [Planctomycetota bacterium]|nr:MAG: hypothetical protein D6753_00355 [Planctomycetota bacterium]